MHSQQTVRSATASSLTASCLLAPAENLASPTLHQSDLPLCYLDQMNLDEQMQANGKELAKADADNPRRVPASSTRGETATAVPSPQEWGTRGSHIVPSV